VGGEVSVPDAQQLADADGTVEDVVEDEGST
jgi:hypothetical protein